jgi:hypothetical protein
MSVLTIEKKQKEVNQGLRLKIVYDGEDNLEIANKMLAKKIIERIQKKEKQLYS